MGRSRAAEPIPGAPLSLTTLGGAALAWAEGDADRSIVLGPGKPLALVTYLALSPRRTASREHLLGILWADADPERAHHALRQTTWQLQRATGGRVLEPHNGDLTLALPVAADRDRFLAAVEAGDLEGAVALYTGEFLPDFAVPGGAGFEQWADLERARLRTAFLRCADSLARRHLGRGHAREAQRLARRARDAAPLDEATWRLLLETLIAGSDWTAAAMEAEALERLLAAEESEPEPATRAALLRARQAPPERAGDAPRGLVAELVGREREFAAIVEAWDAARRGVARHVHLVAGAGLGKTRLLRDALARLRAGGARAVYVRANPGERGIPYALAAELAAALAALPGAAAVSPGTAGALVALNPSLSSRFAVPPHTGRGEDAALHRIVAVAELLASVADEGPVAVLVDDLHWADVDSARVVGALGARLEGHRALLVTAARPTPRSDLETGAAALLRLPPLSEALVGALAASIAALPDEPWAREFPVRLAEAARGSPLLVLESLQLALERRALAIADETWTCPDGAALAGMLSAGSALVRRLDQLDRESRWLLVCLASAGIPLATPVLAQAAGHGEEATDRTLQALEERGLVARAGATWESGHDELATLVLASAKPEAIRAAQVAVGRALAAAWAREPALARHAAALLAAAGDEAALTGVYRQWVGHARRQGDRRTPAALAGDLLGDQGSVALVRVLTAALPAHVRAGLDTPRRQALVAGAVLALGVATALMLTRPAPVPPDAVLVAFTAGPDGARAWEGPLRREAWDPTDAARLRPLRLADSVVSAGLGSWSPMVPSPPGGSWVANRIYDDSGGADLFQAFDDGRPTRRLTRAQGEDGGPAWAPDGSAIVFTTARANASGHFDLALLDLATGTVRPLTAGDAADSHPVWSPDGTRIVFGRRWFDGTSPAACVVTVDGADLTCHSMPSGRPISILGWRTPDEVVLEWDSGGTALLGLLDLPSGVRHAVAAGNGGEDRLSPDGRWVLSLAPAPQGSPVRWSVFPLDRPEAAKPVGDDRIAGARVIWGRAVVPLPYVDTVHIAAPAGPIPLTAGYRLTAVGRDQRGRDIPLHALRWSSRDTAIAAFRDGGVLVPRRPGRVSVRVTAGGWRSDSLTVEIAPAASHQVLSESWREGLGDRWVPFGTPRPAVVRLSGSAAALATRGDSSFDSGVYSSATFPGRGGLGVEVVVSGRISAPQWQRHFVRLDASLDARWLASWDHRTGGAEGITAPRVGLHCDVTYPSAEGSSGADSLLYGCDSDERVGVAAPRDLRLDGAHRLRLQLFPDGRLGLAVDGRPLGVADAPGSFSRPFRIVLEGQSVGTDLRFGTVEAWTGVRGDIDWRAADGWRRGRRPQWASREPGSAAARPAAPPGGGAR